MGDDVMLHFVHPTAAVIAMLGLALKLRDLRRDPNNPGTRSICIVLGCLAGAVLVGWHPLYLGVDTLTGIPNLAKLIEHSLALTAAAAIQILFLHLGDPLSAARRARIRWAILAVVLIVMVAMFWSADFSTEAPHGFTDVYANDPHILPYLLVYLSYVALAMIDIYRASARYARHVPDPVLRLGIRLLSIGSVIGLTYVLHKALYLVTRRLDLSLPWTEPAGSRLLILSGIAFVTSGLALPSLGGTLHGVRHWPQRRRLHRQLHPLWLAVTNTEPDIVLYPTNRPDRDRLILRGMRHALYRRVIEILDGILRLRPYTDPADLAAARERFPAAELNDPHTEAVITAVAIASGIRRKRAGVTPSASTADATDPGHATRGPDADAINLARVADAFRSSPIVAEVLTAPTAPGHPPMTRSVPAPPASPAGPARRPLRLTIAKLVTDVLSPAVLVATLLLAVAWESADSPAQALLLGGIAAATASLIPITYIIRGVRRGRWTDHHVTVREHRNLPLLVCFGSTLAGTVILYAINAPRPLLALIASMTAALAVVLPTTLLLRWKISVHALVAAGTAVALTVMFGPPGLLAVPAAVVVCWSRVALRDHTLPQVLGGAVVGAAATGLLFPYLY